MAAPAWLVADGELARFLEDVLGAMGMPPEPARVTAALMVRTDLRGVDSHGVGMLPRYHEWWQGGFIDMAAAPTVERDEAATGLLDAQKGLGHWVSTLAMRRAIDKARTYGVGVVAVRNSNHFGAAANYSMLALEHDMLGLATTNSAYLAMVPTFGRTPMLSTNPLSFAAPTLREPPFVLDMATTTVAIGKLTVASRWGKPVPAGWALDDSGEPTTDPFVALKHRLLTPLGGSRELGSHKGYGLGVMVDILSGVLAGGIYGDLFWRTGLLDERRHNLGHCFAAIDPGRFRDVMDFKRDMDDMCRALKDAPRADGQPRIWVAGEPEAECEAARRRDGIPLAPALVEQVQTIAGALGVSALAHR